MPRSDERTWQRAKQTVRQTYGETRWPVVQHVFGKMTKKKARRNPGGSSAPHSTWRKRQIIMEPELVTAVDQWHGGQDSYTYSLSSTGASNLVSLSMIDAAIDELARVPKTSNYPPKGADLEHLENTIGDLEMLRSYWKESTAKESGMDITEDEYEYDRRDYGYDSDDEPTE